MGIAINFLVRLLGQKKLTSKERAFLKQLLEERE